MNEQDEKHLESVLRHIENVRENCELLATRLIENNKEDDFAIQLISNGQIHDNSKLKGIEWLYLRDGIEDVKFELALQQHVRTNPHHPEYFETIQDMPRIYLAEFVCDLKARSSEFGTDLLEYIKEKCCKRFKFCPQSKVYKQIKEFTDLLLDKKFA